MIARTVERQEKKVKPVPDRIRNSTVLGSIRKAENRLSVPKRKRLPRQEGE